MTPRLQALLLMTAMSLLTGTGQIFLKKGLLQETPAKGIFPMIKLCFRPLILGGLILALLAPLVYLRALALLGLSGVYGLNGISYFVVYGLSRFILKERGSYLHLVGLVLIGGGIALWSL